MATRTTIRKITLWLFAAFFMLCATLSIYFLMPKTQPAHAETVGEFQVEGGTQDVDYSYGDNRGGTLTVLTDTPLTISNADKNTQTSDKIYIAPNVTANVTLNGVNISVRDWGPGIYVQEGATLNLTLAEGSENVLNGSFTGGLSGILIPSGSAIVIGGTGSLTAVGRWEGAGIGGGNIYADSGDITIIGGTVSAVGGETASGIGSGFGGSNGNITITGGIVTATGGEGPGIGGDDDDNSGNITITGGIVTATGGNGSAGIGGSSQGTGVLMPARNITIAGGTVTAFGGDSGAGIGGGSYGYGGNITITGGIVSATGSNGGADIGNGGFSEFSDDTSANTVFSTTDSDGAPGNAVIYVTARADVSAITDSDDTSDWNCMIFYGSGGQVYGEMMLAQDLTLDGQYTLNVPEGASLTIPEDITLTNYGKITTDGDIINNGTVITYNTSVGTITGNDPIYLLHTCNGTEEGVAEAPALTSGGTLDDGQYYLSEDIELTTDLIIEGKVVICLNGHMLTGSGESPVITVSNGSFTLCDCMAGDEGVSNEVDGTTYNSGVVAGGGVHVNSGATLVVKGGAIDCSVTNDGGNVIGVSVTVGDFIVGNMTGNYSYENGILTVTDGANLTISMADGVERSDESIIIAADATATITLDGVDLAATTQAAIDVSAGASLNLILASANSLSSESAPAIHVPSDASITIQGSGSMTAVGGSLCAGIGGSDGGNAGSVTITGGTVTAIGGENAAGIGNGASNNDPTTFSTNGIDGEDGSALIYAVGGTDASAITDHDDTRDWSGIIFRNSDGMVYGKQTLTGDLAVEKTQTLTVPLETTLTIPAEVTLTNYGTITNLGTVVNSGTVNIYGSFVGSITNGGTVNDYRHTCEGVEQGVTNAIALPADGGTLDGGVYYLTDDVTLTSNLTISGTVTLCLNGHLLKGNGDGSVITVESGANLTLCDCNGSESTHNYYVEDGLYWFDDAQPATGVITGGVITGGKTGSGGGVLVYGELTLNGGTIAGNNTQGLIAYGGGVCVFESAKFTMNDGAIMGNTATSVGVPVGGGVSVYQYGQFIMNGGTITDNGGTDTHGQGLAVAIDTTFIMTGGYIGANSVYYTDVSKVNISVTGGYFANDPSGSIDSATHRVVLLSEENHYGDENYISGYDYAVYQVGTADYSVENVEAKHGVEYTPSVSGNVHGAQVTFSYVDADGVVSGLPHRVGSYTVTATFAATVAAGEDGSKIFYDQTAVTFDVSIYANQLSIDGIDVTVDENGNASIKSFSVSGIVDGEDVTVMATVGEITGDAESGWLVRVEYTLQGDDIAGYIAPAVSYVTVNASGFEDVDSAIYLLQAAVEALENTVNGSGDRNSLQDQITALNVAMTKAQELLSELQNTSGDHTTQIAALEQALSDAGESLAIRITQVQTDLENEVARLEDMIEQGGADAEDLENALAALDETYKAADALIRTEFTSADAALGSRIDALVTSLSDAKSSLQNSINTVQENLDTAVAELNAAIALISDPVEITERLAALQAAYEAADALISADISALEASDEQFAEDLAALDQAYKAADDAIWAAIEALQGDVADLDGKVEDMKGQASDLQTDLDGTRQNISVLAWVFGTVCGVSVVIGIVGIILACRKSKSK